VTTWLALFILAFAAVLLVADESGMIAGLDSTTFGYVALLLAVLVYIGGHWGAVAGASTDTPMP
jgi:aspartyl protease family protein